MSRLSKLRVVDPVLTNLSRGYSNEEFIGKYLFPTVTVEKEAGKIPVFGKEQFKTYGTKRAIRGKSNRIQLADLDTVSYATNEYDLEIEIDYRETAESILSLETKATNDTTAGIKLTQEKQIADLVQDDNNYASSNKVVLLIGSHFDDTDVDPIAVIEAKKEALRALIAKRPNTMIMGASVYVMLRQHPALIARLANTSLGLVDINIMKEIFGVQNIFVGNAVYTEDESTFIDVWGDNIILAYVANPTGIAASVYEPCFGYTLQLKGNPFVDKYEENGGKISVIRSTDNYDIKIVGAESAYLIKDVIA